MAKIIQMTPEVIREAMEAFASALKTQKMTDGTISFTRKLAAVDRKATVYFTDVAWFKMQTLIMNTDKEIGWHGVAKRGDDPEKDEYIISDIVIYPQTVTGATVNTDQAEYENWLNDLDDNTFNNLRMQGHSHVNMGVSPSSVDLDLYEEFLERMTPDMFYIFLIYNKRGDKMVKVYDLRKNLLFETADVTVEILDSGLGLAKLFTDMKEKVKTKQPAASYTGATAIAAQGTTSKPYGGYTGYGYEGRYGDRQYGSSKKESGKNKKGDKEKQPRQTTINDMYDWYDDGYYGGMGGAWGSE